MREITCLKKAARGIGYILALTVSISKAQNPADICGVVFMDNNQNGIFDLGDVSVGEGVTVSLYHFHYEDISRGNPCSALAQSVSTDVDGRYCFSVADDDDQYFMDIGLDCSVSGGGIEQNIFDENGNRAPRVQAPAVRNQVVTEPPSSTVLVYAPEGTIVKLWVDDDGDGTVDSVVDQIVKTSLTTDPLTVPDLKRTYNLQFIPPEGMTIIDTESDFDAGPGGFTDSFFPEIYQFYRFEVATSERQPQSDTRSFETVRATDYPGTDVVHFPDANEVNASFNIIGVDVKPRGASWSFLFQGSASEMNLVDDYFMFIDTDLDTDTGFRAYQVGADYLARGGFIYEHAGEDGEWKWRRVGDISRRKGPFWNDLSVKFPNLRTYTNTTFPEIRFVMYKKASQGTEFSPDTGRGIVGIDSRFKTIDGDLSDWEDNEVLEDSPTDHLNAQYNAERVYARAHQGKLYLGYRNRTNVVIDENWYIFIDPREARFSNFTGQQVTTDKPWAGWRFGENLGAAYMVKGRRLFRYAGAPGTPVWAFEDLGEIEEFVVSGKNVELALDIREWTLSERSAFFSGVVQFFGKNPQGGAETVPDDYTGMPVRWF